MSVLEEENEDLKAQIDSTTTDHYTIMSSFLRVLANNTLELDYTDRVSVYAHKGKAFVMLGRYSKNFEFRRPGRGAYPDREGCIAEAWRRGDAEETCLPDPKVDLGAYLKSSEDRWDLPSEVAQNLVMKPRSLSAVVIEDANSDPTAVVVFESEVPSRFEHQDLREMIQTRSEGKLLASLLEFMRPFEPSPGQASEKGF